jgi:hypothetical protein
MEKTDICPPGHLPTFFFALLSVFGVTDIFFPRNFEGQTFYIKKFLWQLKRNPPKL